MIATNRDDNGCTITIVNIVRSNLIVVMTNPSGIVMKGNQSITLYLIDSVLNIMIFQRYRIIMTANERTPERQATIDPIVTINKQNRGLMMHNPKTVLNSPRMIY